MPRKRDRGIERGRSDKVNGAHPMIDRRTCRRRRGRSTLRGRWAAEFGGDGGGSKRRDEKQGNVSLQLRHKAAANEIPTRTCRPALGEVAETLPFSTLCLLYAAFHLVSTWSPSVGSSAPTVASNRNARFILIFILAFTILKYVHWSICWSYWFKRNGNLSKKYINITLQPYITRHTLY